MQRLRGLDVFSKLPTDLDTSGSAIGGILSVISLIIGGVLFWNELTDFNREQVQKKMQIRQQPAAISSTNPEMDIYFDLTIFGAPCHLIGAEVADTIGNHIERFPSSFQALRMSAAGKLISRYSFDSPAVPVEELIEMVRSKEGCNIHGHITVNKVPGQLNLYLRVNEAIELITANSTVFEMVTFNHQINRIHFGNNLNIPREYAIIAKRTPNAYESGAYDGTRYMYEGRNLYVNFMKILPVDYQVKGQSKPQQSFHFTMYQEVQSIKFEQSPGITFQFEFSPITITYSKAKKSFYHFLVQICAIIGGVFAVFGMLTSAYINLRK